MLKNPESSAGGGGVGSSEYEVSRENDENLSQEELERLSDAVKERSEEVSETGEMTVIEPFSKDGITIDGNGWAEMHKAAWDDETTKDERFRDAVLDSVRKWNATNADERSLFLSDGEQEYLGATQQTELTQDDISRLTAARLIVSKLPGDNRTYESTATSDEFDSEQPVFEDAVDNPTNNNTTAAENSNKTAEAVDTPAEKPEMTEAEKQAEAERLYQLGDAALRDPDFIKYMTDTEGRRKKLRQILEIKGDGAQNLKNMHLRAINPNIKRDDITTKGDERKKPLLAKYYEDFLNANGRSDEIPERTIPASEAEVPSAVPAGGENTNTAETEDPNKTAEVVEAPAEKPEMTEAEKQAEAERLYQLGDAALRDPDFIKYMTDTEGRRKKLRQILEIKGDGAQNLKNMHLRAINPNIKRDEITTKGDERKKPLLAPYYEQFLRDKGREDEIPEGNISTPETEVPSAVSAGSETADGNPTGENTGDDGGAGNTNENLTSGSETVDDKTSETDDTDNTEEESDASAKKPEDTAETETNSKGGYDVRPFPNGDVEVEDGTQETREKAKSLKERFKGIIKRILPLALLALLINPMTMRKQADNVQVEAQRTAIVQEYVQPTEETIPGRIETVTKELQVGDEGYAEEMMKNLKLGDTISVPSGVTYNESSYGAAGHPGAAGERAGTTDEVDIRPAGKYTVDRATTWDAGNVGAGYANYADMYDEDAGKKIADLGTEAGVENPQPIIHLDGVNSSEVGGQTGWVKAEDLNGAAIINEDGKPETYTVEEEVTIPPETRTTPGYYQDVESTINAAGETSADEDKMTIEVDGQAVEINFHREDGSIVQAGDIVRGSDGNDYQVTDVRTTPGETRPQLSVLRLLHNVAVAGAAVGGTIAANKKREENNEG